MTKNFAPLPLCVSGALVVLSLAFANVPLSAQTLCPTGTVCVTTWHNDTYRTGDNLNESTLTYNTITPNTFGKLCSIGLDGQVYARQMWDKCGDRRDIPHFKN